LKQPTGELLDRCLGSVIGRGFDEGEATRPAGVAIEGHPHAADLDPFAGEGFAELLLVYVVRKIPNEKTSTHRAIPAGRPGLL
jgi:hypothetical protein